MVLSAFASVVFGACAGVDAASGAVGTGAAGTGAAGTGTAGGSAGVGHESDNGGVGGSRSVPSCEFTIHKNALSPTMPTVGIVEWSLAGGAPSAAKIVYQLREPGDVLNRGGDAPVRLDRANYRTLLLGLKPARDYSFHIEALRGEQTCVSEEYALPTTGSFTDAKTVGVDVVQPDQREPGFIVTSSGTSLPNSAFIIDADGEVVWHFPGPENTTRALMDYEGENMWMLGLNLDNRGGEMRFVSMDGSREHRNIAGLETAHHDFTVMPGGRIAALGWSEPGIDPESRVLVYSPDGEVSVPFTIGSNLYRSVAYHANAIHYVPSDDSFTIADRNPNLFVKVSASGTIEWQLGGVCDDAPAGSRCVPQSWEVTHGHHLLEDGTFVLFNNTYGGPAHVFEFKMNATAGKLDASLVKNYTGTAASSNLGDVQRLPGGNTLITYASDGKIVELDAEWDEVQTLSIRVGYSSWRPTLYGPPSRW